MGKVRADDFGKARPKLVPEDLEKDVAVLTVATAEEIIVDDDESATGKRHTLALTFEETDEKALWLNKTQVEAMIEGLGDDTEAWIGQKVPVEKTIATFGNKKYPKVVVCAAQDWEKYLPKKRAGAAASRRSRR